MTLTYWCYYAIIVFFQPEPKTNTAKHRVWDLRKAKTVLGVKVIQVIQFVHAILGCDATSRLHGLGKASALKMVTKNEQFLHLAHVIDTDIDADEVSNQ